MEVDRKAVLVATLAATLPDDDDWRRQFLQGVGRHAEVLEVRADLVGDLDPEALRRDFPGKLLYTLRSRAEGGASDASPERRQQRFLAAAEGYDLVDLEAARDLDPEVLEAIPADKRILSWHGVAADVGELEDRFAALSTTPARLYKMVVLATNPGEAMAPLLLVTSVGRDDLLAFAAGRSGAWTRFLAARYGAAVFYGAAAPASLGAPGQLTLDELVRDYGLPDLPPVQAFYGILGNPVVSASLSPRLHNGAYRELGIPAAYLPFEADSLGDFWLDVVESDLFHRLGRPLRGLSVTVPFKRAALAVAGAMSPLVESVGAANTLVLHDGVWEAEDTDPAGILGTLNEHGIDVEGMRVAVLGAGGAGRAAAYTLDRVGGRVTLVNRGLERGEEAAEELDVAFLPLEELDAGDFDLLVHATPLGKEIGDPLPFAVEGLRPGSVVVDMVYRREPTPLVEAVRENGGIGIDGREVLLHQALDQFRLMTGQELPVELGRRLLDLEPPPTLEEEPEGGQEAADEAGEGGEAGDEKAPGEADEEAHEEADEEAEEEAGNDAPEESGEESGGRGPA